MISVGGTFSIPLDSSVEFEFTPRRSSAASGSALPLRDYIADDENALLRTLLPALERDSDLLCPLLLCGPSGTGKTALAVALAEQWKRAHPTGKVLLLTAVDFARAYAHAVDTNSLAELRERFLQAAPKPKIKQTLREYLDTQAEIDDDDVLQTIRLLMSTPEYQLT